MAGSAGAAGAATAVACLAMRCAAGGAVTVITACRHPWQSPHGDAACCAAIGPSSVQPSGHTTVSAMIAAVNRQARRMPSTDRTTAVYA